MVLSDRVVDTLYAFDLCRNTGTFMFFITFLKRGANYYYGLDTAVLEYPQLCVHIIKANNVWNLEENYHYCSIWIDIVSVKIIKRHIRYKLQFKLIYNFRILVIARDTEINIVHVSFFVKIYIQL